MMLLSKWKSWVGSDKKVRAHTTHVRAKHAPAGGFELKAGVSQTIAQEIPLIRMLAKVDIINPTTSGATTAAGKVYFVNSVGNGRVWVDLATYNTTASQSGYMTPTLPATSQPSSQWRAPA